VARDTNGCNAELAFAKVTHKWPAYPPGDSTRRLSHLWHMSVSDFSRWDEVCNRKGPKPETAIDRNQIYGPRRDGTDSIYEECKNNLIENAPA